MIQVSWPINEPTVKRLVHRPAREGHMRTVRCLIHSLTLMLLLAGKPLRGIGLPTHVFQKGMTYMAWNRGEYWSSDSDQALQQLAATGATHVSIGITVFQDRLDSTKIESKTSTPTDEEIGHVMDTAHRLGLQVMLKPHVDLFQESGVWRGEIGKGFSDAKWRAWFESYRQMILRYARLAQEHRVDQFCVGTELRATSHRADDWRETIRLVREVYGGPLTYASTHDLEAENLTWWDALDYIGVDAYFSVSDSDNPSVEELMAGWKPHVAMLARLARTWRKPVLLTEIGYRSANGAGKEPWDWATVRPINVEEQANAYEATLRSLASEPWFAGVFWWVWTTNPHRGGDCDDSYTPLNKPAEDVLRKWYGVGPKAVTDLPAPDEHQALRIFGERPEAGWQIKSPKGRSGATTRTVSYIGNNAISVGSNMGGELSLYHESLDTTGYVWLEFCLYPGHPQQRWSVCAHNPEGDELCAVSVRAGNYLEEDAASRSGEWHRVLIPLRDLSAMNRFITGITVRSSGRIGAEFWVDEIRLLGGRLYEARLPWIARNDQAP